MYDVTLAQDRKAIREGLESTVDDDCIWLRTVTEDSLDTIERLLQTLRDVEPYLIKADVDGMNTAIPVRTVINRVRAVLERPTAICRGYSVLLDRKATGHGWEQYVALCGCDFHLTYTEHGPSIAWRRCERHDEPAAGA